MRAGIIGTVQAATGLGFDQGIDPLRIGRRDRDIAFSEQAIRQSPAKFGPVVATVGALVQTAVTRTTDDGPGLALAVPHAGVDDVRVAWLQLEVRGPHAVGNKQHLVPGLATVPRAEDAAFGVVREGVADGRHIDDVGIGRIDVYRGDLARVAQADVLPGLAGI